MKTLKKLEKELIDLKEKHKSMWDVYGSELCAAEMLAEEEKIERQIREIKNDSKKITCNEDPSQIIDD